MKERQSGRSVHRLVEISSRAQIFVAWSKNGKRFLIRSRVGAPGSRRFGCRFRVDCGQDADCVGESVMEERQFVTFGWESPAGKSLRKGKAGLEGNAADGSLRARI